MIPEERHAARVAGALLAARLLAINALNHWRFARTFDFAHARLDARDETTCATSIGDVHLADGFTFAVLNAWVLVGLMKAAGWWLSRRAATGPRRRGGD